MYMYRYIIFSSIQKWGSGCNCWVFFKDTGYMILLDKAFSNPTPNNTSVSLTPTRL